MEKLRNNVYHILFVVLTIIAIIGIGSVNDTAYATIGDADDGVYFAEEYASPGNKLTVTHDGDISSELTYKWYIDGKKISNTKKTYVPVGDDQQKFITAEIWKGKTKLGEASLFCSNLPVMYINTEDAAPIVSKEEYLDADILVQGNDKYNSQNSTLYSGATEIKGRGNSTWTRFPKKPYRLKLDKKTDLFGLGKSKHWVLLANYIDESLMRNMLAGTVAERMGVGAMNGTWVDLVLNGEPVGNYMLCEHVRLAEDRVNVFDWEAAAEDIAEAIAEKHGLSDDDLDALTDQMAEEDMSWISTGEVKFKNKLYITKDYFEDLPDSFSGGYLLELDYGYDEVSKFTTINGAPMMFKSPEFINTDEVAMATAQNYVQMLENAIYSRDFCTDIDGKKVSYAELCDAKSFAAFWLASELLENEIGMKSTYMQKDIDQPMVFGPVWDFDFSSGSVAPFGAQSSKGWISSTGRHWVTNIMKDPYFAVKVRNEYLAQEEYLKEVIADDGVLDEWRSYLYKSGIANDEIWGYSRGFESDCDALKEWLTERITWMDKQFATNASAMKSMGISFSNRFSLSLQAPEILAQEGNSYTIAADSSESVNVTVNVENGNYPELNFYVNSHYAGTETLTDGKVDLIIRSELLTENIGDDNVITVWLKDGNGTLAELQYLTVKIDAEGKSYNNVVFNDMGGTYSNKVESGKKVYLDEPLNQTAETAFEGWSDGTAVWSAGQWYKPAGDVTFTAVWKTCTDGTYTHTWTGDEDILSCSKCGITKKSGKTYIDVATCTFTQSSRYYNRYTGSEVTPVITVSHAGVPLTEGKDYNISVKNNVNVGFATYTVTGIKSAGFDGTVELTYRIIPRAITKAEVKTAKSYTYKGSAVKPEFELTYNGKTLVRGTDYTITYENNNAAGVAKAKILGAGNFNYSRTVKYVITPARPSSVKANLYGHDDVQLKWSASKGATGYYVYYKKPGKTKYELLKKTTGTSIKKASLLDGKKYAFRVIPYITISKTEYKSSAYRDVSVITLKKLTGVKAKSVSKKYNKIYWNNISGESGYQIAKSKYRTKNFKVVKTVGSKYSSTSIKKTDKRYYYKVRAYKTVNGKRIYGPWSKTIRFR